ncbi:acetylornithine deacetylase or succinyl-diaminopimelate desuccinylase [Spirochaeta thermophila DSM 6578]|uniref:Acetylornithine deacetylase or succinyl-diaminopimelate desuccinylase n=1 Tax=Winmispira thermophila (strain ATCC 700085 / DSM 6578 / Z-1203) TaxID=869211 RepID=G0GD73_WINT7|nr:M20 family metallo-hydrolase [Spirochaeta thermophila]AEJ62148.1 acetylornithine deacetylase or succinyl-diaminopimelate desuccinylase [Spirochaeta thermophila DSM 6578]
MHEDTSKRMLSYMEAHTEEMVELQRLLTSHPALSPEVGGRGEWEKAQALVEWLEAHLLREAREKGVAASLSVVEVPDERAERGSRPSILVELWHDRNGPAFWIMTHLDVVPPGEVALWNGDPFTAVVKEGRIYGRGTEDNQQSMTSSIFAARALVALGLAPERPLKLLFVADEEFGNRYGIQALVTSHRSLFKEGDVFLVPDGGLPDGSMIEVAEKQLLWLKFTTRGRQCHASRPDLGKNAFVAASDLVVRLSRLDERFPRRNDLFVPPCSTFVPSRKDPNVPNINTVPGEDVFYMDCRVLPEVDLAEVMGAVEALCREVEAAYGVEISVEVVQRIVSRPTPADAPLVDALKAAVEEVYGVEARPMGIGGGTVAAPLRNEGFDCVVWSTVDETAHQPNEYCVIEHMVKDAGVMALLALRFRR